MTVISQTQLRDYPVSHHKGGTAESFSLLSFKKTANSTTCGLIFCRAFDLDLPGNLQDACEMGSAGLE